MRALPTSYLRVNFLFNEQPDKAIEAFIEVVKVDPQTIELHSRRRPVWPSRRLDGQSACTDLVERPVLARAKACRVARARTGLLESRLLDRAEELFLRLVASHAEVALKFLLEITSRRRNGTRRSTSPNASSNVTLRSHPKESRILLRLASNEMMQSRPEAARPIFDGVAHHRLCVRANMLLGDLETALMTPKRR